MSNEYWAAICALKGTVSRDFRLVFSMFPPSPWVPLGQLEIFSKIRGYSQLKVHHRCCWRLWQMEKIFNYKVIIILFGQLWEVELTYRYIFALQVYFKVSASWYCSHYLPQVSLTLVANFPLVSTTLAKLVAKFITGVVDTGGAPWLANISANFRKIRNGPDGILWSWGKTDSWKKPEAKNLVTLSLSHPG